MSMFARKPTSHEARLSAAAAQAGNALSIFHAAAAELEAAADEQFRVEAEVHAEVERLQTLAEDAASNADANRVAADRVRNLFA